MQRTKVWITKSPQGQKYLLQLNGDLPRTVPSFELKRNCPKETGSGLKTPLKSVVATEL